VLLLVIILSSWLKEVCFNDGVLMFLNAEVSYG